MYLAIDLGSSSLRVGVFDADFKLQAQAEAPWEIVRPTEYPDRAEANVESWWEALLAALGGLGQHVQLSEIAGVGVSTIFPALVAFAPDGSILLPAQLYSDRRTVGLAQRLEASGVAARLLALDGAAPTPGTTSFLGMIWLREERPRVYRTCRFGHANSYLGYRLTGELALDPSNASLCGLLDGARLEWSEEACRLTGLDRGKLPPLIPSGAPLGEITRGAAAATGLPAGTPVALGAGDTICAALGAGALAPGDLVVSTGTTDTVCLCLDEFHPDPRSYALAHIIPGLYLQSAPMSCTGGSLAWFRDVLAPHQSLDQLLQDAEQSPPGSRGVVFTPYLAGERAPLMDPAATAAFAGLTLGAGRADLTRAVLEGVACGLRHNLQAIAAVCSWSPQAITLAGKPAQNRLWSQIRADVTGLPVRLLCAGDQALLGAALCAASAAGDLLLTRGDTASLRQRLAGALTPSAELRPREELRGLYDELYSRYLALYPVSRTVARDQVRP